MVPGGLLAAPVAAEAQPAKPRATSCCSRGFGGSSLTLAHCYAHARMERAGEPVKRMVAACESHSESHPPPAVIPLSS